MPTNSLGSESNDSLRSHDNGIPHWMRKSLPAFCRLFSEFYSPCWSEMKCTFDTSAQFLSHLDIEALLEVNRDMHA